MAGSFLQVSRHGTIFYFRRRVPDDLRAQIGQPYLVRSLGTGIRKQAMILARALASITDGLFAEGRAMTDKKIDAKKALDEFASQPDVRLRIRAAGQKLALEEMRHQAEMVEWEVAAHTQQRQAVQDRHQRRWLG